MIFKNFTLTIITKSILVLLTILALVHYILTPGYYAVIIIISFLLLGQCVLFYRFVAKTNAELVRFLDAARHADFSQRFKLNNTDSSYANFNELGNTFTDILKNFQQTRSKQAEELIHLKTIIEHAPTPLISIHSQGQVTLWNNSARQFFGSHSVKIAHDLHQFGKDFSEKLGTIETGGRKLVTIEIDGMEQKLTIAATQITIAGQKEKLISMQDIKNELDDTQLQSWQDLVKVLTHEIVNSITPVASLAQTAVVLLDDIDQQKLNDEQLKEDLADISNAVTTVAGRSDALIKFISSYRRLTHIPEINIERIKVADFFDQVTRLATHHWGDKNIQLTVNITPKNLDMTVDISLLEQSLINLLNNAEQALEKTKGAVVSLNSFLNKRGHLVIEIADNGDGIADDITNQIFVPFFTTKQGGSGVGLALTRQIMIAHQGSIKYEKSHLGGALFRLTF